MHEQTAEITWRDDQTPVSTVFDDPYYSLDDGVAETRHVFLQGNRLPPRFKAGFHIAELGFGTGLNLCVALQAWIDAACDGPLRFTSFEAFPMNPSDMRKALSHFPSLGPLAEQVIATLEAGKTSVTTPQLEFELIVGDARQTVPAWEGRADAWFLDGFSPAKNPQLWEAPLMQAVFDHTQCGGTAATYAAAGFVRRNLADAGFSVERVQGFGRKRHMTTACRP